MNQDNYYKHILLRLSPSHTVHDLKRVYRACNSQYCGLCSCLTGNKWCLIPCATSSRSKLANILLKLIHRVGERSPLERYNILEYTNSQCVGGLSILQWFLKGKDSGKRNSCTLWVCTVSNTEDRVWPHFHTEF